jgi:UDP-glucose 4-epimerase
VRQFIFSSTCAVYGNPAQVPVTEDTLAAPISPYGWSKLMTEIMLRDAGTAHDLRYVILRYFNVAGADPNCRTGQSTKNATQLIKVAVETASGFGPNSTSTAPIIRRRMVPAFAITFTLATLSVPIRPACATCAPAVPR